MAQITVEMWKSWASLSDQEIAIVVSHAKHNEQPLKNGCKLIVAFPISACALRSVQLQKEFMSTPYKKHRQNWWNVYKPSSNVDVH